MKVKNLRAFRLKLIVISAALALGAVPFLKISTNSEKVQASASGPAPTFSGAPGESNCTACHSSFLVNSGSGGVVISGLPANYLPNQQIPVTVTVNQSDAVLYGFELTALDTAGSRAGTYSLPTQVPPMLQLVTGFVNGVQRQYVEHTSNGTTPTQFGTKSWQFNWTAPSRRIGRIGFYAAGNGANSDGGTGGDQIYTTSGSILSGSAISSFDGDGSSDLAVFRPSNGVWYSVNSNDGAAQILHWGLAGDIPTPGDYDGDGKTDRAVYRPSEGRWYVLFSTGGFVSVPFGLASDVPVPGDYDGDLRTDFAVFRPSEGNWYVANSTGGNSIFHWGLPGDITAQGDFDGDAITDAAVYRPSEGVWYVRQSSDGPAYYQFGLPTDRPVQGDYDGDGRHDIAIYRPSSGQWWINGSSAGVFVYQWGISEDNPSPGDFDGDGKTDISVFRPSNGVWYTVRSSDQSYFIFKWGLSGDVPITGSYIAQ